MTTNITNTPAPAIVGPATLNGRIWNVRPLMPWSGDTTPEADAYRTRNAGKARNVRTWLGVRYAHPPVGERRWKEALDYDYPAGTFEMDKLGNVPIQTYDIENTVESRTEGRPEWGNDNGGANWASMVPGGTRESEDCLFLHIWSPSTSVTPPAGGFPVVAWVHGGGFISRAACSYNERGHRLATKGVVVVQIGYRLGQFGYMWHPDFEGEPDWNGPNFGLSDVKSALRWIQRNIASFGGNPAKVMLGGSSAGGVTTQAFLGDPDSANLFSCAWVSSGGGTGPNRPKNDSARRNGYTRRIGMYIKTALSAAKHLRSYTDKTKTLEQEIALHGDGHGLRLGLSPDHIIGMAFGGRRLWRGRGATDALPAGGLINKQAAWIETEALNDYPWRGQIADGFSMLAKAQAGGFTKPCVILSADNEATMSPSYATWSEETASNWLNLLWVPNYLHWASQAFASGWSDSEKRRRIYGHAVFTFAAWRVVRAMVETASAPAWLLYWGFSTNGTAGHSGDVAFNFGNIEWNTGMSGEEAMVTERALRMSEAMMRLMANFANSGNPNTAYVPPASDFFLFGSPPILTLTQANDTNTDHWNVMGKVPTFPSDAANGTVSATHQAVFPGAWNYYRDYYG